MRPSRSSPGTSCSKRSHARVRHGLRDDQHPHGVRAVLVRLGGEAGDARGLGCGAAREFLVVPQGHGAVLRAQRDGRPALRLLDGLPVDPAARRLPVDDVGDVRDGVAEHLDGAPGDVAGLSPARAVAAGPDRCALGRYRPVLAQGAVRFADGRAEGDLAGGRVQGDVPVVGARGGEVADRLPVDPAVALGDLEEQRLRVADDGAVGQPQPVSGQSGGLPERFVPHGLGVYDAGGAADAERLGGADGGRGGEEGLARFRLGDPAAQPARLAPPGAGERVVEAGTCSTTSPGRLSPPVVSRSTSQAAQPSAVHASQASGGCLGSTPTPSTWLSSSRTTTHSGTAALSPNSMRSPGRGASVKQLTSLDSARSEVRSTAS